MGVNLSTFYRSARDELPIPRSVYVALDAGSATPKDPFR